MRVCVCVFVVNWATTTDLRWTHTSRVRQFLHFNSLYILLSAILNFIYLFIGCWSRVKTTRNAQLNIHNGRYYEQVGNSLQPEGGKHYVAIADVENMWSVFAHDKNEKKKRVEFIILRPHSLTTTYHTTTSQRMALPFGWGDKRIAFAVFFLFNLPSRMTDYIRRDTHALFRCGWPFC